MPASATEARSITSRLNMALGQLTTREVVIPHILNAVLAVQREKFVPEKFAGAAYVDEEIPLGNGRFLLAPFPFARMLMLADVREGENVMAIGCATGYSLAVLSRLGAKCIGCETEDALLEKAQANLAEEIREEKVTLEKVARLSDGYLSGAPYDKIIIEGAVPRVPEALTGLLAEGGMLVTVEHPRGSGGLVQGFGWLVEYVKRDDGVFCKETKVELAVATLPGFEESGFEF